MFKESMTTEGTPERVFALAQLVAAGKGSFTQSQLKEYMEPKVLDNKTNYFSKYLAVAEEVAIIEEIDGAYSITAQFEDTLKDFNVFRQRINSLLHHYQDGPFYQMTKRYLEIFPDLIRRYGDDLTLTNSNVMDHINEDLKKASHNQSLPPYSLTPPELRGWRFWASALGFGRNIGREGMIFIPNPATFLLDLIHLKGLAGQEYSVAEFLEVLQPEIDILISPEQKSYREIPYALASALKTLEPQNLKTIRIMDTDLWALNLPIREEISRIQIQKGAK